MTSKYTIHDVAPDGSCFYRSVYNALKYYGYLLSFCLCVFGSYVNSEDEFVTAIRKHLAKIIREGKDQNHIHSIYTKLREDDDLTYSYILEGMPSWFVRRFPNRPSNENSFREQIAAAILKKTSWASEIDIPIMIAILRKCFRNKLDVAVINERNDTPSGLPKGFKMDKGKLYLLNLGETHYNYVVNSRLTPCSKYQIRNPTSLRCVKVQGRVGRKLLKQSKTT